MRLFKDIPVHKPFASTVLYAGERLCDSLSRARLNGAPIDSSSSPFYDSDQADDDFSVDPITDIRTDRFALAESMLSEHPRSVAEQMTRSADGSSLPDSESSSVIVDSSSQSESETSSVSES
ncbi:hypothetical protein [Tortoise microvirus 22]|nr:hypothetical protein [Tortoise microvirus 22]